MILIHRGHEHSGRLQALVEALNMQDFWAFSWDCRGHGHSPGERGYAENYYALVKDLNAFVSHISERHQIPVENMAIIANSVGGVTASTWVHDFAPPVKAMVLAAPAFKIKLYVPLAIPLLRTWQKIRGKAFISSYVKSKMLTHDREQSKKYDEDPLITKRIAVNVLLELGDTAKRIVKDAGAICTPTLLLTAGADWVVRKGIQKRFFDGISSPMKEHEEYPGFYHGLLYEKDRRKPIRRIREFINRVFQEAPSVPDLIDADQTGYTKKEFDALRKPAPFPRSQFFKCQKLALKSLGRLSNGIRLGWKTGFDSGQSLDYVYRNKARGAFFMGKIIDRCYLDAIGWKGIRQRSVNLKKTLRHLISHECSNNGDAVKIVDLAAGPGRYVMETMKTLPETRIHALLRDYNTGNLDEGRQMARSKNLTSVTFEQGDAFNPESIRAIQHSPHIAIVSGLYELFPDNRQVLTSLRGIAGILADDGFLVYTNQPWHPQVELIARTLSNRDGNDWIMRRRTQKEMDDLVRNAGFEKISMEIDQWGIFTVSAARLKKA